VIAHVTGDDITIDRSSSTPTTIECETCSVSKATEIVSQRTEVEDLENNEPFDWITWDMIKIDTGYNGDKYISYFQCRQFLFNLVYTHRQKSDTVQIFKRAINIITN
jgi:hypothetical protein